MSLTRRAAALGAAAALALGAVAATPGVALGQITNAGGPTAIPGRYVVVFDDGAVSAQSVGTRATSLAGRHGATVEHTYTTTVRGFAGPMSEATARRIAAEPGVRSVSPDREVTAQQAAVPWGLDRIDQRDLPLDGGYQPYKDAADVSVFVLDTGIRTTHAEFGARALWARNFVGDGIDTDCNGHGTGVASVVGGATLGVARGATLYAVKVLDCNGRGTTSSLLAGLDYAAPHLNPGVVVLALGGVADPVVDAAVTRASEWGRKVVVAAAGNQRANACGTSPARVQAAITVAGTASNDSQEWGSNHGPCVDLYAPGWSIPAAAHTADTATQSMTGTSIAAAHTAGVAATHVTGFGGFVWPPDVRYTLVEAATRNKLWALGPGSPNRLLWSRWADRPDDGVLHRGQTLTQGHLRQSSGVRYLLTLQTDGNLVQYDQHGTPVWHTNTHGSTATRLEMQFDGNLVLYDHLNRPLWHTNTWGTAASRLEVQADGNLVLYDSINRYYWHRW